MSWAGSSQTAKPLVLAGWELFLKGGEVGDKKRRPCRKFQSLFIRLVIKMTSCFMVQQTELKNAVLGPRESVSLTG